ncbi:transporter substrate-binding domain-containing protein, partial [Acinetobacter baumannii]
WTLLLLILAAAVAETTTPVRAQSRATPGDAIKFCVDPDWPPYEVINRAGVHEGIAADLLRLAADRAGLQLVLLPTGDWEASLAASRRGDCDM